MNKTAGFLIFGYTLNILAFIAIHFILQFKYLAIAIAIAIATATATAIAIAIIFGCNIHKLLHQIRIWINKYNPANTPTIMLNFSMKFINRGLSIIRCRLIQLVSSISSYILPISLLTSLFFLNCSLNKFNPML